MMQNTHEWKLGELRIHPALITDLILRLWVFLVCQMSRDQSRYGVLCQSVTLDALLSKDTATSDIDDCLTEAYKRRRA